MTSFDVVIQCFPRSNDENTEISSQDSIFELTCDVLATKCSQESNIWHSEALCLNNEHMDVSVVFLIVTNERSLTRKGSDSDAGQTPSGCTFQGHQFKVYKSHLREKTSHMASCRLNQ